MEYLHIKNLEKFHPGYKDRTLQWGKIYFKMVQGNPDCDLIENEIDWGRLIKLILLELEAQQPIPNIDRYWLKKGFDIKKRPMSLTIRMLHNFLEVIQDSTLPLHVDKDKEEDKDKSKNKSKSRYGEFVYMLQEEYMNLIKCIGKPRLESLITDLNNYIGSTGKKYKSHYHTILTWARKETKPKLTEAQKRTAASFNRLDEMEGKK